MCLVPLSGEGSEINAPANEDFYPVITKPEPQLSSWFKQKMREGKPPIATEDDDITPWGEETSANADLASYVDRQLKVTGRKDDKESKYIRSFVWCGARAGLLILDGLFD